MTGCERQYVDDEKLTIIYKGDNQAKTYEYRFEDNNLIITDDSGNDNKFIKQK